MGQYEYYFTADGWVANNIPQVNMDNFDIVRNQRLTFNFADGKQSTVAFIVPKALEKAPAFEWIGCRLLNRRPSPTKSNRLTIPEAIPDLFIRR